MTPLTELAVARHRAPVSADTLSKAVSGLFGLKLNPVAITASPFVLDSQSPPWLSIGKIRRRTILTNTCLLVAMLSALANIWPVVV